MLLALASCDEEIQSATTASTTPTITSPPPTPPVVLRDLEGLEVTDARGELSADGLTARQTDKFAHAEEGTVIRQDPPPGTEVEDGSSVELTVAAAYPRIPRMVGKKVDPARNILKNVDYKVKVVRRRTTTGRHDVVLAQMPAAKTEALPGRVVTLVVWNNICTPGYSPCLRKAYDYDCIGGGGDPPFTGLHRVTGYDTYNLDSDNDGYGCE